MLSSGATLLSNLPITTNTCLANAGFDLSCHPNAEQIVCDGSYGVSESKRVTPIQYLIEMYGMSNFCQEAFDDMLNQCDKAFLHAGRVSALEYAVTVNPTEVEMIQKIAKKSFTEDVLIALKLVREEQTFRKEAFKYYVFWVLEMVSPAASPLSWVSQESLDELLETLEAKNRK